MRHQSIVFSNVYQSPTKMNSTPQDKIKYNKITNYPPYYHSHLFQKISQNCTQTVFGKITKMHIHFHECLEEKKFCAVRNRKQTLTNNKHFRYNNQWFQQKQQLISHMMKFASNHIQLVSTDSARALHKATIAEPTRTITAFFFFFFLEQSFF